MDPVTSLATGHAAGKLIDRVAASFRANVIERWSKRRAQDFFDEFCREVEPVFCSSSMAWIHGSTEGRTPMITYQKR